MIKAILFDFDGVLTTDKTGTQSISNYICKKAGIELADFKKSYYKFNEGLLNGEILHAEIWETLCNELGFYIDFKLLEESFIHTPIDENMIKYAVEWKKNYKIAMVTDNKADRIQAIVDYYHWKDLFDVVSVSANIKSGKDYPIIFEETIKQLNVEPRECIFIDNTEKNLLVPQRMGMKTILFEDEKRDLKSFLEIMNGFLAC